MSMSTTRSSLMTHSSSSEDIEARFGGGVAAYFTIFRWQSIFSLTASIIILLVHIPHLIQVFRARKKEYGKISKAFSWSDLTGIPFFLQFQSYTNILFTAMSLAMILFFCLTLMYQVIQETRVQSEHVIKSKDMEKKQFSKLLLNCWDHSQVDYSSVRDQRFTIAQSLRLLLDQDKRREEVSKRPSSQKILLIVRKILSNIFLVFTFIVAIGSIVTIRQFDSFIQKSLGSKIDISKWPSWIPFKQLIKDNVASVIISISIVIINYLTPTISSFVTKFERWDEPKTALRLLVVRYFILRIAMTYVLMYQFAVLLDLVKGGCEKCDSVGQVGNQLFFVILSALGVEFIVDPLLIAGKYIFQWIKTKLHSFQLRRRVWKQIQDKSIASIIKHHRVTPVELQSTVPKREAVRDEEGGEGAGRIGEQQHLHDDEAFDRDQDTAIEVESQQSANKEVDEESRDVRTEKEEFQTAPKLMSLIYIQTVMWMCLIYYPFGVVIIGICNIFLFKLQIVLVRLFMKKPKQPVDARTQSGLFTILYAVSFLSVTLYYYYALDLHRVKTEDCGPMTTNKTIMESLKDRLRSTNWGIIVYEVYNHTVDNSALVWLIVGILIVLFFWRSYNIRSMNGYLALLRNRLVGEQKVYEEKMYQQEQETDILRSRLEHLQQQVGKKTPVPDKPSRKSKFL